MDAHTKNQIDQLDWAIRQELVERDPQDPPPAGGFLSRRAAEARDVLGRWAEDSSIEAGRYAQAKLDTLYGA